MTREPTPEQAEMLDKLKEVVGDQPPLPSTIQGFEFDLGMLFAIKTQRVAMQQHGRLMGKHCQAKLERAKNKRKKHSRKMKPFTP